MKVLVLGGTGAMGKHLVDLLSEDNIETWVTSRSVKKDFATVKYVRGNALEEIFIKPLIEQNFDCVVDFMVYGSPADFKERLDLFLNHTKQYIYLSSSRVYAQSENLITENSPRLLDVSLDKEFLATNEYALIKVREENILFNCGRRNWTIIRPYITYSETRLQLGVLEKEEWLYRAMQGHKIVIAEEMLKKATTLTYGRDVAKGIKALIGKEDALGEAFHITQDKEIKWEDAWNIYKDELGKASFNSELYFCSLEELATIHQQRYQIFYDRMYDRRFDNSKIKRFIDTSSFVTPEEGLRSCISDFIQKNMAVQLPFRASFEGRADCITKEWINPLKIKGNKNKIRYIVRRLGI